MKRKSMELKVGQVVFELQEHHDFQWLQELGTVFCVFDQQDSGNISFGVERSGIKQFVKYAGSRPIGFSGDPIDAITRLKAAMPLYTNLNHPHLINLVNHYETKAGFVAIFEWFDGECLHSHWLYAGKLKYTHPQSPFFRFKQLPLEKRLKSLDAIFEFHHFVESRGYVAVDFYDGSILYNFSEDRTKICDIDFYRLAPSVNDMGEHFWGAVRTKSPEEYIIGTTIDSKTNVYTMGAIAFGLIGGEMDHSLSKWEGSKSLYEVVVRAVSEDREQRFQTVDSFKRAWDSARSGK
ncbi:serine/threonine protein kinase [Paenibacillus sp. NPDC057967]|uniref:serine/threonine protein kinase n=1 Tax=Paenibacillus sp. NPDC057967 TaxID=3346293 RepID=UPI0036D77032